MFDMVISSSRKMYVLFAGSTCRINESKLIAILVNNLVGSLIEFTELCRHTVLCINLLICSFN